MNFRVTSWFLEIRGSTLRGVEKREILLVCCEDRRNSCLGVPFDLTPRRWNIQADPKRMRFAGHSFFANVSCNTEISGNSCYPFCFCATRNIPSLCFLWYFTRHVWCSLMRILLPWRCVSNSLVHREFREFLVRSYWLVLIFTYVYGECSKILKDTCCLVKNVIVVVAND